LKKCFFIISFLIFSNTFAQLDLSAGMGLAFFNSDDLEFYLNSLPFAEATNKLNTFNSSADFFLEFGYEVGEKYQLGVEYNFNIYSFNTSSGYYDLSINRHKPSLIGYYIIKGVGYKVKFGVGTGIRLLQTDEKLLGETNTYSTSGIGFVLKVQGDTKLSGNLYALIAGELRYDLPGEIKTLVGETIGFNSIGVGLKLGTVYYF